MKLLGKCERCGAPVDGDDYLCKACRDESWETRYRENTCGNCRGHLEPGDKYCRICVTKAGEGAFEPWLNIMQCVYGPRPVLRRHECGGCGYVWETKVMIDRQRYCPKCGHDTYADMDPLDPACH